MSQSWSDAVSKKHMRAICQEIGDRLRYMLNRTAEELPPRLAALLRRFQ
jgi:hypothetical protein